MAFAPWDSMRWQWSLPNLADSHPLLGRLDPVILGRFCLAVHHCRLSPLRRGEWPAMPGTDLSTLEME